MLLAAERVVVDGEVRSGMGIRIDARGHIEAVAELSRLGRPDRKLAGKLLVPGFVNAHSHAFHRLLRGRTQIASPQGDSFWTWREAMYRVAAALDPEALFVAARQAFIEMLLAGITTVGEFHYLHHTADGNPYTDPLELIDPVLRAANAAGIRLCLLDALYMRGDFASPARGAQLRFADDSLDAMADRVSALHRRLASGDGRLTWGVAAHSLRTVPIDAIVGLKTRFANVPLHIHASEQHREVLASIQTYGGRPVELLANAGVLDGLTTLVHATHVVPEEMQLIAQTGAIVCVCPSTEADLGDGLTPAADFHARGVPLCLGTDGQTLSSIVEEARRLEMHERLRLERRNLLAGPTQAVAPVLLRAAGETGAAALGLKAGRIAPGMCADLVSYSLDDPTLAGADDDTLLAALMLSADSRALRDVMVAGRLVVEDGQHADAAASGADFTILARRLFS